MIFIFLLVTSFLFVGFDFDVYERRNKKLKTTTLRVASMIVKIKAALNKGCDSLPYSSL